MMEIVEFKKELNCCCYFWFFVKLYDSPVLSRILLCYAEASNERRLPSDTKILCQYPAPATHSAYLAFPGIEFTAANVVKPSRG